MVSAIYEIILNVTIKKMNQEEADDIGTDKHDLKNFDLELVDGAVIENALEDYFRQQGFEFVLCRDNWPWKITKLEKGGA